MKKKILSVMTALVMLATGIGISVPTAYAKAKGFSYDKSNFAKLELDAEKGFSLDDDGNLKMTMQAETIAGGKLSLGGKGVEGEKVRFKIVYSSTSVANNTAQYYDKNAFVYGGDFFQLLKMGKNEGRVRTAGDESYADMFNSDYEGTKFYYTVIIDMNTKTGAAEYGVWQKTSEAAAKNVTDFNETDRRKLHSTATARSSFTAGGALGDFTLGTQPNAAGTETEITVYEVSLEAAESGDGSDTTSGGGFEYDSSNFEKLAPDAEKGFSLDNDGNLKMTMQAASDAGGELSLGGAGVAGENVRFKIIYRDTTGTGTAQYYGERPFVDGGGFFGLYKQAKKAGSLQMSERLINAKELFAANYQTTLFYNTLVIDMNTVTGEAKYAFWQCISLEQAQGKTNTSGEDTTRQKFYGTGKSALGANSALGDIVLNTKPIAEGTSTEIIIYEVSLDPDVRVDFNGAVITEEADGGVKALYTMKNESGSDVKYTMAIAAYTSDNSLVNAAVKNGTLEAYTELAADSVEIKDAKGAAYYKAFVWSDMKPLKLATEVQRKASDEFITYYYPGYTKKAMTFSYDDGLGSDKELVEIFNRYGIKGTFNLVGKFAPTEEEDVEAYISRYAGHEVANHSQNHLKIGDESQVADLDAAIKEITDGRDTIKSYFGNSFDSGKWGFVWPYGRPRERGMEFVEALETKIKNAGAVYIRPVSTTGKFDLPTNWLLWEPTSKDDDMLKYSESFLLDQASGLRLLYLWGHAADLRTEKYGVGYDDLKTVLSALTSDAADIWSATNMEIYDYINAVRSLVISDDKATVTNNSDTAVYAVINGQKVIIPANGIYTVE